MKITIAIPYPNTLENWDKPTDWQEKEINETDAVLAVEPLNWNGKIGNKVYFLKEGSKNLYTYWHFVTNTLILHNINPVGTKTVTVNENKPEI